MLVPTIIFGAAVGAAWWKAKPKTQAAPDPMVAHVFHTALNGRLTPDAYRKLAAFMDKWGYVEEARVLKARASYGELPASVRAQHQQVITAALQSTDPVVVRKIADNLYNQGAIANGVRLRKHAAALSAAAKVAPVEPPAPAPPSPPASSVEEGSQGATGGPTQDAPAQAAE